MLTTEDYINVAALKASCIVEVLQLYMLHHRMVRMLVALVEVLYAGQTDDLMCAGTSPGGYNHTYSLNSRGII